MRPVQLMTGVVALGLGALAVTLAAPAFAADKPQPVHIRFASDIVPPPHPAAIAQVYFGEELAKLIPGSTVRLYPAGSLYKIPEAVEAMTDGNLEMTWGQFGKTSQIDPYMSTVNGPMLLTTPGAMNQIEHFATYKALVKRFKDVHGIKIFGVGHLSMYIGIGGREPLRKLDEFAGKKLRSMGPAENVALERWGASAVTMAFGDVPPALETKVIDGLADQPWRLHQHERPGAVFHGRRHQRYLGRLLLDRRELQMVEQAEQADPDRDRNADGREGHSVPEGGELVL